MFAQEDQSNGRKQSVGSAKVTLKALRQLTEMSNRVQAFEVEVTFGKSQTDAVAIACDKAASSASRNEREAKMLEFRIRLLKDELDSLKKKL